MTPLTPPAPDKPNPAGVYARLALASLAMAAAVAAAGYWPTLKWAGADGVPAMLAGVGIALVAALAGLAPPALAMHRAAQERISAMFQGIVARFAVAVMLTLAAALSDWVARRPLLIWMAIGYIALMIVDNVALVRLAKRAEKTA